MKVFILLLIIVSSSAQASDKIICIDRGNFNGSYSLDITGYEKILNGSVNSMAKILNFKGFRSFEQPVAKMVCSKPNGYLDGPSVAFVCRSGLPSNDYGPRGAVPYEAIFFYRESKLVMSVRGPSTPPTATKIFCEPSN